MDTFLLIYTLYIYKSFVFYRTNLIATNINSREQLFIAIQDDKRKLNVLLTSSISILTWRIPILSWLGLDLPFLRTDAASQLLGVLTGSGTCLL